MCEGGHIMWNQKWFDCVFFFTVFLFYLLSGCTPQKITTGAFTNLGRMDNELQRGVSTKMDVQRALGAPNSFGGAILLSDPNPRDVWYYNDIAWTDFKLKGGIIGLNIRQQILLIFFDKGVFDGYLWSTNAREAEDRQ